MIKQSSGETRRENGFARPAPVRYPPDENNAGTTVMSYETIIVETKGRVGIIQFDRRGRPKESSAPGRARHKPSDHRAGKAE